MAQDEPGPTPAAPTHQLVYIGAQVPLDFRESLKASAARNNRTTSGEIRHALRRYLCGGAQEQAPAAPTPSKSPTPDTFPTWAGDSALPQVG